MKFARKYEILPTPSQKILIKKSCGAARYVYNWALSHLLKNKNLKFNDLSKMLTILKKQPDKVWLNDVNAQALNAEINNLKSAIDKFYKNIKKNKGKNTVKNRFKKQENRDKYIEKNQPCEDWGILPYLKGFPEFKNRFDKQSFSNQQDTKKVQNRVFGEGRKTFLTILKFKNIPIVLHTPLGGIINTVTITVAQSGRYFASIFIDDGKEVPELKKIHDKNQVVGIDVGLKDLIITHEGKKYDRQRLFDNRKKRLAVLQRRLQKKRDKNSDWKNSKKYELLKLTIAKQHEKVDFERKDYIHKTTADLVHNNKFLAYGMEDLNVSGMVKNHKLAASLADASFGEIKRQMKYKCEKEGKVIIEVDRFFPSSKICSICHEKNDKLTMKDRFWACSKCGTVHDRDINAAVNIQRQACKQVGL